MEINTITFGTWKNTIFPVSITTKAEYSINRLADANEIECSYKNGILKATKNGKDIFIKKTTNDSFSKDVIKMHKEVLPETRTLDEIMDRLSLEG